MQLCMLDEPKHTIKNVFAIGTGTYSWSSKFSDDFSGRVYPLINDGIIIRSSLSCPGGIEWTESWNSARFCIYAYNKIGPAAFKRVAALSKEVADKYKFVCLYSDASFEFYEESTYDELTFLHNTTRWVPVEHLLDRGMFWPHEGEDNTIIGDIVGYNCVVNRFYIFGRHWLQLRSMPSLTFETKKDATSKMNKLKKAGYSVEMEPTGLAYSKYVLYLTGTNYAVFRR